MHITRMCLILYLLFFCWLHLYYVCADHDVFLKFCSHSHSILSSTAAIFFNRIELNEAGWTKGMHSEFLAFINGLAAIATPTGISRRPTTPRLFSIGNGISPVTVWTAAVSIFWLKSFILRFGFSHMLYIYLN